MKFRTSTRLTHFFISAFAVILFLIPAVSAAASTTFSLGSTYGYTGEAVSVPVNVYDNTGFVSASLIVEFDTNVFELKEVKDAGRLPGAIHTTRYTSAYYLTWENDTATSNYTVSGTLATLVFQVKDTAAEGNYTIKVRTAEDGVLKSNGTVLSCGTTNGTVTVKGKECTHEWGEWTYSSRTKHKHSCDLCGEVAYGKHSWDDGVTTEQPTQDSEGTMIYTCETCKGTKTITLDPLPGEEDDLSIISQPKSVASAADKTVSFSVGATGSGLTYQWQYRTSSSGKWADSAASGCRTDTVSTTAITGRNGYQYRCLVRDRNGNAIYSDIVTITVNTAPAITTQPKSVTSAADKKVSFSVGAKGTGLTYQWQYRTSSSGKWANSAATGCKSATVSTTAVTGRNGYQYRCKITDKLGNTIYSNAATLTVATPASITSQPNSITAVADKKVSFSVGAKGTGLTYQWQYRTSSSGKWTNSAATGCKTATVSTTAVTGRNGYQYRCKITDKLGNTIYSNAATLTVATPASITSQPNSITAVADKKVSFSVGAKGTDLTYQWQYRTSSSGKWANSAATGCKTATVSTTAVTGRNGYQYRCKITDKLGNTVYSKAATLKVVAFTTQPKNTSVTAGTAAKFTVKAIGPDLTYQWQYRTSSSGKWTNTSFSGYNTATLKIPASSVTTGRNGYQYRCVITSGSKTVYSKAATITVKAPLNIEFHPNDVTVSRGSAARFMVEATGSNLTYQWQYRTSSSGKWYNTSFTGYNTDTLKIPASSVTTGRSGYQYRCAVTSGDKTVYSDPATITVH